MNEAVPTCQASDVKFNSIHIGKSYANSITSPTRNPNFTNPDHNRKMY